MPFEVLMRSTGMEETIDGLWLRMEAAALALDFAEARRCRDRISLMRGGATASEAAEADFSGLDRQQPGAMGLGTGQPRREPPADWQPPVKPDPMTSGQSARKKGRKK